MVRRSPRANRKVCISLHLVATYLYHALALTLPYTYILNPSHARSKIAEHIAAATPRSKSILIDCFAGAGGNTIAFALSGRFSQIFALERDPSVLACAKHNASLYGVEKDIFWIQGDCFDLLRKRLKGVQRSAVLFASPPWGGPEYSCSDVFDLESMQPYGLREMYEAFSRFSRHVVLYLPRTSDLRQVAGYGEDVDTVLFDRAKEGDGVSRTKVEQGPGSSEKTVTVKHYCMRGASKVS